MEHSSENDVVRQPELERGLRVLSLDGGGVRGLSSLLVLRHLMKRIDPQNPPKPCEYFDLIGGTSTGGLIAIMLGRLRMSVPECIEKYKELSSQVFKPKRQQRNVLGKAKDLWKLDGAFDATKLEEATKKILQGLRTNPDERLLDKSDGCKVFVLAMRAEVTRPARLRSYDTPTTVQDVDCSVVEAVRATSAASSFFSPVTIDGQVFIDAAVGYNNPVEEVLEEVFQVWGRSRNIERFVSIGTGIPSLSAFGTNLAALGESLVKIATDTQKVAERFERDSVRPNGLSGIYFRFNPRGMEGIGLDEPSSLGRISAATTNYLNEFETLQKINAFAVLRPCFLTPSEQQAYLRSLPTYDVLSELSRVTEPIANTFSWVLDVDEFKNWSKHDGSPILQILGKPGCGKSVLLAYLRHTLERGERVAFFACKQSEHVRRSPEMILSSLLRQILHHQPNLFRYTVPMSSRSETWTYAQLWASFKGVLMSPDNKGLVCMIDALDECLRESQRHFVRDLWRLSDLIAKGGEVYSRLIITSRNYVDLTIPPAESLDLNTHPRMAKDLETFINFKVADLILLRPLYSDLCTFIIDCLKERAKGMYRLIELIVDELYTIPDSSAQSIRTTLHSVPHDIGLLYDSIWERIPAHHHYRAKNMFAWILCSFSPIDITGFGHVIAAFNLSETRTRGMDLTLPTDPAGDVRRLFGPLVSVSVTIEASHPSVKDHFLQHELSLGSPAYNRIRPDEAHDVIAVTCLQYLNSFSATPFRNNGEHGLVSYALENFSKHVAHAGQLGDSLDNEILRFFDLDIWVDEWTQSMPRNRSQAFGRQVPRIYDALSFSAYYGRPALLRSPFSQNSMLLLCSEGVCSTEVLRLVYLSLLGLQRNCLQEIILLFDLMLFKPGVSMNLCPEPIDIVHQDVLSKDHHRMISFNQMAAYIHTHQMHNQRFQRTESMRLSLQSDISHCFETLCPHLDASTEHDLVNLGSKDWVYTTSLVFTQYMLSTYGSDSVDILRRDNAALLEAILSNRTHAAEFLIQKGAGLDARDARNATALHLAAGMGNAKLVTLLLNQQTTDVNIPDNEGRTALHYACSRYNLWDDKLTLEPRPLYISRSKTVAVLLKHGAHRRAKDHRGNTPFQTLSQVFTPDWDDVPKTSDLNWREDDLNESIGLLMQDLVDVAAWDSRGTTVLHQAAFRWPVSALEQLLRFLASFNVSACLQDHHGNTPLHYAALRGFDSPQKAVAVLCHAGVDPRIRAILDESALAIARRYARKACITELERWENKFDIQANQTYGGSWLMDRFGVDADTDHAAIRSQVRHSPRAPLRLTVASTGQQRGLAQRAGPVSLAFRNDATNFPSLEVCARQMLPVIFRVGADVADKAGMRIRHARMMKGDPRSWNPAPLPRVMIESMMFAQHDLSRHDGLSYVIEESLLRPLSRARLEESGMIDWNAKAYHMMQDANHHSIAGKRSLKHRPTTSGLLPQSQVADDEESESEWEDIWDEGEGQWDEWDESQSKNSYRDEGNPEQHVRSRIDKRQGKQESQKANAADEMISGVSYGGFLSSPGGVIVGLILIWYSLIRGEVSNRILRKWGLPLGGNGWAGFQYLQRSGRQWEYGDRTDPGWL